MKTISYPASIAVGNKITVAQFKVFLRLLYPIYTTSTLTTFTSEEWRAILEVSTTLHHDGYRKLALRHLDHTGALTDIELVRLGRRVYMPLWVLAGYRALVKRQAPISKEESYDIGVETAGTLMNIRRILARESARLGTRGEFDAFLDGEIRTRFGSQLAALEAASAQFRAASEDVEDEEEEGEEDRHPTPGTTAIAMDTSTGMEMKTDSPVKASSKQEAKEISELEEEIRRLRRELEDRDRKSVV